MGNQSEFLIDITGDASGIVAAAQKAEEGLRGVTGATEASGPAADAAKESTLELGGAHRDLHRLMHMVTEESPALGLAMRAAMGGVTAAAVMGLVLLLRELKRAQDEAKKAAEEMAEEGRKAMKIFEDAAWSAKEGLQKLRQSHDEWIEALLKGSHTATTAMDAQIARIKEQGEADKAVMEARKQMAEDDIRLLELRGKLTHEQAQAQLALVESIGKQAAIGMGADERKAEISEVEKTKADVARRAAAATAAAAGGMKSQEAATQTRGKREAELGPLISEADAKLDKARKEADETAAKLKEVHGNATQNALLYGPEQQKKFEAAAESNARDAGLVAQDAKGQADALKAEKLRLQEESAHESTRVKELQEAARGLNGELEKLTGKLNALRSTDTIKGKAETEQARAAQYGAAAKSPIGQAAIGDVQQAEATAKALEQHKGASPAAQRQLIDVASAIAGHAVNLQQAVAMMDWAAKSQEKFVTQVMKLATTMNGLASGTSALKGHVDSIEREIAVIQARHRDSFNQ